MNQWQQIVPRHFWLQKVTSYQGVSAECEAIPESAEKVPVVYRLFFKQCAR